jgi:hypothetical protein
MLRVSPMRAGVAVGSILAAVFLTTGLAHATVFMGTTQNVNPIMEPPGRCGPPPDRTVQIGGGFGTATGTSNLGAFSFTASHCFAGLPPGPYTDGLFDFDFGGGNDLLGTYAGTLTASGIPGVFDNVQGYVVTGGTGLFNGASGSFAGTGAVSINIATGLATSAETFSGVLSGVPEPATWTMLIFWVGLIGLTLRRRRPILA